MKPIVLLAAGLALVTLACAPGSAGSSASTSGDQPKYGGTFHTSIYLDPNDWDVSYNGKSAPHGPGIAFAYDGLLGFKQGPDVEYSQQILAPELAESWEVSPDAKTFTFRLRKGVNFATMAPVNGRELTAADVKWSYEYFSRTGQFKDKKLPGSQIGAFFDGVLGVDTPDPYTVIVRFANPLVPFLYYAASDANPIVPHELYDRDGHLKDGMIGTGPYQLDPASSQSGSKWVFKKNPTYREAGKPYIDQVDWLVIKDSATELAAFQTKQLDHLPAGNLNKTVVDELLQKVPDVTIYPYNQDIGWHMYISVQNPPFNNLKLRQALALSIDRDEFAIAVDRVKSPWAPPGATLGMFTDQEAHAMLKYDPAQAKKLVAEAGYPNGITIEWEFVPAVGLKDKTAHEILQSQFKKVGINMVLKAMERNDWSTKRKAGDLTLHMLSGPCTSGAAEYDSHFYNCYKTGLASNYTGVKDPVLDKMLDAERAETNPEKRMGMLKDLVRHIHDNVYAINLVYSPNFQASQSYLKGYRPNLRATGTYLTNAWLAK